MGIAFGALVYLGFSIWADPRALACALAGFPPLCFLWAIVLALGNYALRFLKWHYYLRKLEIDLPLRSSVHIFLCGLVMSITPGKLGELLKPYLVREVTGTPIAQSAPIVFAERLTDLVSVLLLAVLGIVVLGLDARVAWVSAILVLGVITAVAFRPVFAFLASLLRRVPKMGALAEKALIARAGMQALILPGPLLLGTAISLPAWFLECLAFHYILSGFGVPCSLMDAVAVYAFATLAGAVTMLPGGLGATEASMAVLLENALGVPPSTAAAATLVIRVATLWFAIILGASAMATGHRLLTTDGQHPR